jgi:LPXTG-site transpeptidase (sortase) family protein
MMPTTDEGVALAPDEPRPDVGREAESLEQYLARVEAARLPGRRRSRPRRSSRRWARRARAVAVVAVIAACAALPWVAPQVPGFLAGLVPGGDHQPAMVEDPPVEPSTDAFVGPVGVSSQAGPYDGVRLESAGQPREVVVRRLHVDSTVVPISGQSGTLLPPSDPKVLGWWQEGRPVGAQEGTAVVTGHTVHTGGGALDHLDQLVVGDVVRVRTDRGWITYTIQRNRIYSRAALARNADTLFRLDGPGRLVLITCDDWNGSFYESNAVVVAIPVDDEPFVPKNETAVPDVGPAAGRAAPSGNMEDLRGVVAAKMFDR